ncbi:MAG: ACP S-malonyltransferase, partial [Armatimonadetes bacterium]|nr:ACP S-malonyltransferase [Armatimonadota bacterium]
IELSRLMREGPAEELTATEVAQPALLTHSVAVLRVLDAQGLQPDVVAGHSLGEYSALVAAGALDFESALQLVRHRGKLMAADGQRVGGTMAAIIGLDQEKVEAVVEEAGSGQVLVVANYNCPGQVVVSGAVSAVERACELAKERGAKGSIALKVSGAFHSPLMTGTAERFGEYLHQAGISDARVPIVSNVDATARSDASGIVQALARQINHNIRWEESVRRMIDMGAEVFVEVGPKRVLTRMIRRIDDTVEAMDTSDGEAIEEVLTKLA